VGFWVNIPYYIWTWIDDMRRMLTEQLTHDNVLYIEADQVMSINQQEARAPEATATQTGATWVRSLSLTRRKKGITKQNKIKL
jgi:hypothetical protein